jgi:hypothetical protein
LDPVLGATPDQAAALVSCVPDDLAIADGLVPVAGRADVSVAVIDGIPLCRTPTPRLGPRCLDPSVAEEPVEDGERNLLPTIGGGEPPRGNLGVIEERSNREQGTAIPLLFGLPSYTDPIKDPTPQPATPPSSQSDDRNKPTPPPGSSGTDN